MKRLSRALIRGALTLLPLVVTAYVLWWLGSLSEDTLGSLIRWLLPEGTYLPGMGVAAGLTLLVCLGLVIQALVFRRLVDLFESLVQRIPLVNVLYGSVRDLSAFFSRDRDEEFDQVCLLRLEGGSTRVLGFVTRRDFSSLPDGMDREDQVAVYVPMSYQIGGFTLMVPAGWVEPVEMSMDEALRFTMTAGLSTGAGRRGAG